jgi:peroxiredoxin
MSSRTATKAHARSVRREQEARARQAHRRRLLWWGGALVAVVAVVGVLMWTARSTSDSSTRQAPDFTLTDTNGSSVHLADLRGHNIVLYFSEGAGCQSCILQMADIERNATSFQAADVKVLPIVMNTADQIKADLATNGIQTPFLLDNGTVSAAYGTLGKGMHAGLPGHSFVLIDTQGIQRWYGEYPSMYLSSTDLLKQIRSHLNA